MPSYYLETSGAFKRYRTERESQTVAELFDGKAPDEGFISSYLTSVEVEATAARALRGRVLTLASYRAIVSRFAADFSGMVDLWPVSNETLREAAGLARLYSLRALDAVHLATARIARQSGIDDLVFVTSDRELVEAATRDGFALLDLED